MPLIGISACEQGEQAIVTSASAINST